MIRLSVDTSFEHLGLCLTRNGAPLANYYSLCNRRNSKIIFGVIDDLLKNEELNSEVELLAMVIHALLHSKQVQLIVDLIQQNNLSN